MALSLPCDPFNPGSVPQLSAAQPRPTWARGGSEWQREARAAQGFGSARATTGRKKTEPLAEFSVPAAVSHTPHH